MTRKARRTGSSRPSRFRPRWAFLGGALKAVAPRVLPTALVLLVFCVGVKVLEARVARSDSAALQRVRIVLADRPGWMPASVAEEILASLLTGREDLAAKGLTRQVCARANAHPWIRSVRFVKRRPDSDGGITLEVSAAYHRPVAQVQLRDRWEFVSDSGVRLPVHQVPKYEVTRAAYRGAPAVRRTYAHQTEIPQGQRARRIHYIVIYGVRAPVPVVGEVWGAADLADGLRLVSLIETRTYANQITVVDVSNYGGRIHGSAPHLRMYAQMRGGRATDIRFGQFPADGEDYVVSPQRKLSYLDQYVSRNNGRLAGVNEYLDLRYDQLHVSIN